MTQKIKDYTTGKEVSVTPEELIRQDYEYILIDGLNYPKADINTEVPIQRGSRRRAENADIVVFKSARHDQKLGLIKHKNGLYFMWV